MFWDIHGMFPCDYLPLFLVSRLHDLCEKFQVSAFLYAVAPNRIQVPCRKWLLRSIVSTGNIALGVMGEIIFVKQKGVWNTLYIASNRTTSVFLFSQDDRLREPLQKLKLAVSNVMPEQLCKYQEDCQARNQAKNAK